MKTKSKINTYMGLFMSRAAADSSAKSRKRYGYATRVERVVFNIEGTQLVRYRLYESQRPVRHTWWEEHLPGESGKAYLARMKRRGVKASIK